MYKQGPRLFDDDVIVFESNDTRFWNRKNSFSFELSNVDNNLFNNESEDEMERRSQIQPSKICTSFSHVATQVNSYTRRKCMRDASTCMEKTPAHEAIEAYFTDHPFLDFAGRCGGIVIVAILLYNLFSWYARLLQCARS